MASEYRNYNLPFYVGWQLHFILRGIGAKYQSFTSITFAEFRIYGDSGIHNFVENSINELTNESRTFKIKYKDIAHFEEEIEVWGLNYVKRIKPRKDRGFMKITVYGRSKSLNLFETYQRNAKKFPKIDMRIEESPKV